MLPGTARHTPPTSKLSPTSATASAMASIRRFDVWGVVCRTSFRSSPSVETTPTAILVPPTSTPIAFIAAPPFPSTPFPVYYLQFSTPGVRAPAHGVRRIERPTRNVIGHSPQLRGH